jgi:aspartyl protease family protein
MGAAVAAVFLWPDSWTPGASTEKPSSVEMVIQRSNDLHYYADGKVNGHATRFMVDTGSSETALTEEDALAAGLAVDRDKYELIGEGASGIVRGQYIQVRSLDLGAFSEKDVKVVVVPGATTSLLGQDFLDEVDEIIISRGEMRLKGKSS